MTDIAVLVETVIDAEPDAVFDAIADYEHVRGNILPPTITDYLVLEAAQGAGARFSYHLHATKRRVKHVDMDVTEPEARRQLLESDRGSSLTTLWTLTEAPGRRSRVEIRSGWNGASGVAGFFERRFAPKAMHRLYEDMLHRLASHLSSTDVVESLEE